MSDNVEHPAHYTQHPSGVECIEVTEHMGFCVGNAVKYLWRHDLKGGTEDLRKAIWYIEREIQRVEDDADTIADCVAPCDVASEAKPFGVNGLAYGWCTACRHHRQLDIDTLLCNNCNTFARGE